ncbi:MAG: CNNM domain-containing protein [Christensenellaceae bacterium]|jgi:hypothetical protein|nr:CNNM domain-containing protein [Christensenellaceae bacterium]
MAKLRLPRLTDEEKSERNKFQTPQTNEESFSPDGSLQSEDTTEETCAAEPVKTSVQRGKEKLEAGANSKKKERNGLPKPAIWTIKIIVITFALSAFFSYISELTTSSAPLTASLLLLVLLIVIAIIFDAVAVAVTACDLAPLLSMASRRVTGGKTAVYLVRNAEKVNNICGDVIGDICSIISGACTAAIVIQIITKTEIKDGAYWFTIIASSIVASLTIGGKAVMKGVAVKNSKEIVLASARLLDKFRGLFPPYKRSKKRGASRSE